MIYSKYVYNNSVLILIFKFMWDINLISEQEVDKLIFDLLILHSKEVKVDEKDFVDLLKHSLSLNTMEKKRVIDAVPTLSQFQFDELTKVFTDERVKFRDLAKQHPEDIKKLVAKQQSEWIELGDLYKAEDENKVIEDENQDKIDDIKAGLGL